MSDLDDTQPHAIPVTPNVLSTEARPNPADAAPTSSPSGPPAADPASPPPGAPPSSAPPPVSPPLQAAPPPTIPSAWREPPWIPPKARPRGPSLVAIVVGLIILAVGLYFFVDRTLGIDLPVIHWGSLWPILLIVVGGLIVVRALNRNR
jgi:hypothetical protein